MNDSKKNSLLEKLKAHIVKVQSVVEKHLEKNKKAANMTIKDFTMTKPEDELVFLDLKENAQGRHMQLASLHSSPYFVKCEIKFDDEKEKRDIYFSKFQLSEESIYSWIAPAATMRFEKPGKIVYQLPKGSERKGTLFSKEQYMIVEGKPVFFARESISEERELVYQEHFSIRKAGFMLPEIVQRMEKAQDQVIRAHHRGPLVISGPAGSGKTTLALHRIAYLIQSPETAAFYPAETIAVFVQDASTKDYFSHLLPELGINDVKITTFEEWARNILALDEYSFAVLYGDSEDEKEIYEYKKIEAMRNFQVERKEKWIGVNTERKKCQHNA
jgi:DNA helicase-2/ATP-dependent DNA helicase PcrA